MRQPQTHKSYFWPVVWAVAIHALLLAFLFISFASMPELPPARPIVKATLYQLESQNRASSQTAQKIAGEAEQTRTPNYDQEQLEQKKQQQDLEAAAKRRAEQAAQRAEQARQQAAQKAAEEQKRQAAEKQAADKKASEQKKLEQQKAEQARLKAAAEAKAKAEADKKKAEEAEKKAQAERKKAEEQKKLEAERKKAEDDKKKAEQARQKAEADKKKREAEAAAKQAAEKARDAQRRAEEERKAAALADLLGDGEPQFQRSVADRQGDQDAARLDDLIVELVSRNWSRPESARRGMLVELMVDFLPDGTISQVSLVRSSGNAAFDNSAIAAVRNVVRVRELQSLDRATYERLYRKRKMAFRPEDLSL